MRCLRMSATIPTSLCLSKQIEPTKFVTRRKIRGGSEDTYQNIIAHPCYKCPQAAAVKKGKESDVDIDQIKKAVAQGNPPAIMRTCSKCHQEKSVSQFMGSNSKCRKCSIADTRARMKEANREETGVLRCADIPEPSVPANKIEMVACQDPKFRIEIAGQSIQVCQECLRRYLGI